MPTAEAISEIINRLYVAAADDTAWSAALTAISELYGGAKTGINHQNFAAQSLSWTVFHEYDVEAIRLHYEVINTPEKNVGLRALLTATPLEPFTISSFLTPEQFYADPGVNVALIPQNIHHGLLNVVDKEGANTSLLVYRGREQGDFTAEEIRSARLLGVHVRNAARLANSNLLGHLHSDLQSRIPGTRRYGTALLTPRGRIIDLDRQAQTILESLTIVRSSGSLLMNGALCEVSRIDFAQFLAHASALADFFVRVSETRILQLKLLPAPYVETRVYVPTAIRAVAIRLIDLAQAEVRTAAQLYGFTNAEATIAELMCGGLSQNEIAERLAITRNTMKSHLKSPYSKTGTEGQGQLIALLLKLSQ